MTIEHTSGNQGQVPEFLTNYSVNVPLKVRRSKVQELLALPQFKGRDIMELINSANSKLMGKRFDINNSPAHVTDRATAIAVLVGVK